MAEPILQFFAFEHLPEDLQRVSKPFGDLAHAIESLLPRNAERTIALRKLLEAKDAAVRAKLFVEPEAVVNEPSPWTEFDAREAKTKR
jgi:hypothetical protein